MDKNRLDNLDIIKAFAIMGVVSLHVGLWQIDFINGTGLNFIQYALRQLSEGVPVFVAVNGFLLFRKKSFDLKKHRKKMKKLFFILVIWSMILTVSGYCLSSPTEPISGRIIYDYFIGTRLNSTYTGVLWFIQNLLAVYLIFPALWYLYKEHIEIFNYIFIIMVFFVCGIAVLYQIRDIGQAITSSEWDVVTKAINYLELFNPIANGWYLVFFCLGGIIVEYLEILELHRKILLGAALLAWPIVVLFGYLTSIFQGAVYGEALFYNSPLMLIFLTGLIVVSMPYKSKGTVIERLLASIGRNTFGIYLSHFLFIFICNLFRVKVDMVGRAERYLLVFICAYIFSIVVKRIPVLKYIIEL